MVARSQLREAVRFGDGLRLLPVLTLMVAASGWAVDRAAGTDGAALIGGLAGLVAGTLVTIRPMRAATRIVLVAATGCAVGIVLAAWTAQLPLGSQTMDRLGTELVVSLDAAWHGRAPGEPTLALGMALLAWTNASIAIGAVAGRQRLRDPILLLGAPLLVAMILAPPPDLFPLVVFAAAALLLNLWTAERQRVGLWHRRVVEPERDVAVRIRRAGWLAGVGTVALAWILASVAVSAPLNGALRQVEHVIRDAADGIAGGPLGIPGAGAPVFGSEFEIGTRFDPSDRPVVTIDDRPTGIYLRGMAYDHYTGLGWEQDAGPPRAVAAYGPVLSTRSLEGGERQVGAHEMLRLSVAEPMDVLLAPLGVVQVSRSSSVSEASGGAFLVGIHARLEAGDAYSVTSISTQATAAQLTGASTTYPADLVERYLDITGVSERTIEEAMRVVAGLPTPYARATALVDYLGGEPFSYTRRIDGPISGDRVDWFLFEGQEGFCEQYASAMAIMARAVGIPSRLVRGYAGGQRMSDGTLVLHEADSHAWAELYFPGYGWQVFEATPGSGRPRIERQETRVDSSAAARPSTAPRKPVLEDLAPPGSHEAPPNAPTGADVMVALMAVILAAALLALAATGIAITRRRPVELTADQVWERVAAAGARAGVPARASDTPFEYARALQRRLPGYRREIAAIVDTLVTTRYSPPGRRSSVAGARWAELRRALIRLELRHRFGRLIGRREP